jgi:hypothetical protein
VRLNLVVLDATTWTNLPEFTGPVFGYVLEGEYEHALDDEPVKTYKAGDMFYEPSGSVHRVARNPSGKTRTRLLETCGPLGDSCWRPELPRRDADEALEVMGELALVREAGAQGDLRQGQARPCFQELFGPLDAAQDDVLVRRQPGQRHCLQRR